MMSSQYESFPFSQSSQASDSGPSPTKNRDSYGLSPFTVKQISDAYHSGDDQSNVVIDGIDVANVTLVGLVTKKTERQTDVRFTIYDGTGQVDCIRWVPESFDLAEMEAIHEGMYVRVNGNLKPYQGKRQMIAFAVRPVTNFDEVSFHYIECIHFHLQNTNAKGEVITQSQFVNTSPTTPARAVSNGSLQLSEVKTEPQSVNPSQSKPAGAVSNGSRAAPSSQVSDQLKTDGLKEIDQIVLSYLQQPAVVNGEGGVSLNELCQKLMLPLEKIKASIKFLEDEGLIFSTIDEDHYKGV